MSLRESAGAAIREAEALPPGLDLVAARPVLRSPVVAVIDMAPGDRALVAPGERVIAGTPLVERLRDPHLDETPVLGGEDPRRPGDRLSGEATSGRSLRRAASVAGELVFRSGRRWRVATGEVMDPIEAPGPGVVREVRAGTSLVVELEGSVVPGVFAVGVPTRGQLAFATDRGGEVHATGLDVGRAGTILVVGSRVDAEALTRARAMGVRGIVVAGLSGKELRDFSASERRQRAALHRLPPFAVLVLDGVLRRPIASPVMVLLEALAGREVGIVTDPPGLLVAGELPPIPAPPVDWVRVRNGPYLGREGRWQEPLGARRFAPGVHLEAGLIRLEERTPVVVPLADLERFD